MSDYIIQIFLDTVGIFSQLSIVARNYDEKLSNGYRYNVAKQWRYEAIEFISIL